MEAVISNSKRKFRGSRPDGISLPSKGNRNSSYLGSALPAKDETMKFPEIVFGNMRDYRPTPAPVPAVYGGVSPDSPRSAYDAAVAARATAFAPAKPRKSATRKPGGKRPATRKAPAPGTRPSLSNIRAKG